MRLKLDGNLAVDVSLPIADAGHDISTVSGQGLSGCDDQSLYEVCQSERRVLVTLSKILDQGDLAVGPDAR